MQVYLDNNATTPVDRRVIAAVSASMNENWGNPASTSHAWGWRAEEAVLIAREEVSALIEADPKEIIFTSGATEAINLAILGFREAKPKRIIHSAIEHKAVFDVAKELRHLGFEVVEIKVDRFGKINLGSLEKELATPTALVSIVAANNEIGTVQDLKTISSLCRAKHAFLHLDIVQLIGKEKFSVKEIGADLVSLSGHKIYGPKGCGALYLNQAAKDEIRPVLFGGGHERGLRSGTLNVPGIVGLGTACKIIRDEFDMIHLHLKNLTQRLKYSLSEGLPGLILNGEPTARILGNLNYRLSGINASALLAKLGTEVAISSSSACLSQTGSGSHVLEAIGLNKEERDSSFRIGIGRFNTEEEIDFAAERIISVCKKGTVPSVPI